jgi:hypothetical protein
VDKGGPPLKKRISPSYQDIAMRRVVSLNDSREVWHLVSTGARVRFLLYQSNNSSQPSLDIKKAIACLLVGGSKKMLPDGMRLRGDINVLLLGDPGTAKSQLLKFVEKIAPISVYTSGKGSSAAGLTAVVQRDPVSVSQRHNAPFLSL